MQLVQGSILGGDSKRNLKWHMCRITIFLYPPWSLPCCSLNAVPNHGTKREGRVKTVVAVAHHQEHSFFWASPRASNTFKAGGARLCPGALLILYDKHVQTLENTVHAPYFLLPFSLLPDMRNGFTPASREGISYGCWLLLVPWNSQLPVEPLGKWSRLIFWGLEWAPYLPPRSYLRILLLNFDWHPAISLLWAFLHIQWCPGLVLIIKRLYERSENPAWLF